MSDIDIYYNDNDRVIKKSNDLIRSYYDLSLTEQRIILVAMSYIEDHECRIVDVPLSDYKKYLKLQSFNYEHFYEVLKTLRNNSIVMAKLDKNSGEIKKGLITGWVDRIEFEDGFIKVDFNRDIWDHIVNLKKEYTKYQLSYVLKLQSKHSVRLFEILKSYEYKGAYNVKIDELRRLLFLENKYTRYTDFDNKIIKPSIDEINSLDENVDINITYEPYKVGNRYDSIKFTITKTAKDNIDNDLPPEVEMARSMDELSLFMSIKTMLTMKYKCIFTPQDLSWQNHLQYTKQALESTYVSLLTDEWKDHQITNHKAFFAEHLKRLSA